MKIKIIETYVREIEAESIEQAREMWHNDMECLCLTPEDFESVEFYEAAECPQSMQNKSNP